MSAQPSEAPAKKKFKMPDIYIVLVIFILLVAAFTYIIPAGQYERENYEIGRASCRERV